MGSTDGETWREEEGGGGGSVNGEIARGSRRIPLPLPPPSLLISLSWMRCEGGIGGDDDAVKIPARDAASSERYLSPANEREGQERSRGGGVECRGLHTGCLRADESG